MDKQPTQEQIKEFWEWCGLTAVWNEHDYLKADKPTIIAPGIDLNNLFKYAVPKLPAGSLLWYGGNKGYGCCINYPHIEFDNADPALALFWAIWEVIHG